MLREPLNKKSRGMSLLELLLVLTGVAMIMVMSIQRYHRYHQQITTAAIMQDIATLHDALNNYFYEIGCDAKGIFPLNQRTPSMHDLGLNESFTAHPPLIEKYTVTIVSSGKETKNKKPLYLLQINAIFNAATIPPQQLQWYQKILNAADVNVSFYGLTWKTLPENNVPQTHSSLWILAHATRTHVTFNQCAE